MAFLLAGAFIYLLSLAGRIAEDVRIAAEVARPLEWPIVVLDNAEAAV